MRKTRTKLTPSQIIALNEIASYVCRKTNINIKEYNDFRDEELIKARTLFFIISLKKLTIGHASLASFINKDHATIYHAKKIWDNYLQDEFGVYFDEFFNGEKKIIKEVQDLNGNTLNLTKLEISVLNELKKLNDTQLLEFKETRLKPYIKVLESRIEQNKIVKVNGAMLNR